MIVLIEILQVMMHVIECEEIFKQLKSTILSSFTKTLIPIIEEICLQRSFKEDGGLYGHLSDTIVQLFCQVIVQISEEELLHLVSTSTCLQTLRSLAVKIFAGIDQDTSRQREVFILKALLHIVSMPCLVTVASGQQIAETIELFVGIISKCQECQIEAGFTCQDRSRYRWAALCLRNVSRSAVVVHRTYKPWVWGPHWLYKNDMDWLIQFLNDDEKALQKIGLGMFKLDFL
jgi:hypothetical protein